MHLRNRDQFLNYFQVYPSENNYIPGIASLMMHYGWRRVVIITEKVTLFTEVCVYQQCGQLLALCNNYYIAITFDIAPLHYHYH